MVLKMMASSSNDFNDNKTGVRDRKALSAIGFEPRRLLYFVRKGKEGDRLREVVGDRVSPVVKHKVTERGKICIAIPLKN